MQSLPSAKSEILLFNPSMKQVTMETARWVDYHPISAITKNGPINFEIKSGDYLDLNDTSLYIKYRVIKNSGVALVDVDVCAPVNMLHSALFSDIKLSLNGTKIESSNGLYPYKAMMITQLQYSDMVCKNQFRAMGYVADTAGKYDSMDKTNEGFRVRKEMIKYSAHQEMMGPLFLDLFTQSRYLLPNTKINLTLDRSSNTFCLMSQAGRDAIEILDVILYVRTVTLHPNVVAGHELGLKTQNALYPIQRSVMKNINIAAGSWTHTADNLFNGIIPKTLVIGMVEGTGFNGDYQKNPMNFQHFDLNSIGLYSNGQSVPCRELKPDFKNNLCMTSYVSMFQNLEMFGRNKTNSISYEEYAAGGMVYFVFNLTPDLDMNGGQVTQIGNLRLELSFATALKHAINVIMFAVHDDHIQITEQGKVL